MSNSNTEAYLHITWTTKNRINFFDEKEILDKVIDHIQANAIKKKIRIMAIGGFSDHLHVLIRLSVTETVSRTVKLLKGESSWWIRRNIKGFEGFQWQEGYHMKVVETGKTHYVIDYI